MNLFDAHCHILPLDVYERATQNGIRAIAVCGTSSEDWKHVIELAEKFPIIGNKDKCQLRLFPMLGIHPYFVSEHWKNDFQTLETYCIGTHEYFQGREKGAPMLLLGVGECGLDFSHKFNNRAEQEACFVAHLKLAAELDRPIAIHCVKAWGRLLDILREYPSVKKIIHAFSGAVELIPELASLNCWFSLCGNVTNPNAKRARAAAVAVPEGRLLIESDAPDFPPEGCDTPNEPSNLIHVARAVAELRDISVEALSNITFSNSESLM